MKTKVAIIGNGWVGKAMQDLFPDSVTYVRDLHKAIKEEEIRNGLRYTESKEEVNKADIAFICVPTPNLTSDCACSCHVQVVGSCASKENGDCGACNFAQGESLGEGKLDTSIVEECIKWCECPLIVVRSTVNPGDCSRWQTKYSKKIVFQPEYLGETPDHPLLDTLKTPFLIIGGEESYRKELIDLYSTVYNANTMIRQTSLYTAEVIKLTENRAIAMKVAQCQELYDVIEKAKALGHEINYHEVRDAVFGDDPRFNRWFTFVFPNERGFNSKCIPKDVYAWAAWAESLGYEPKITRAILEKNKEWII